MRNIMFVFFVFKQKTAYEVRISDWSSDVCSSDLVGPWRPRVRRGKSVFIAVSIAGKGALHVSPRAGRALADCSPILARSSMGSSYPAPWTPRTRIIAWHIHRELKIGRATCRERVCQ